MNKDTDMTTDFATLSALIAELRAREQGATKGPWTYQERSDGYTHILRADAAPGTYVVGFPQDHSGRSEADARFTAAARNAMPQLLAHIESLQRKVDGAAFAQLHLEDLKRQMALAQTAMANLAREAIEALAEDELDRTRKLLQAMVPHNEGANA